MRPKGVLVGSGMASGLGGAGWWDQLIEGYTRALGMTVAWSFFAPDPGTPKVELLWEALDSAGQPLSEGVWPESAEKFFFQDQNNKRSQMARFMAQSDTFSEAILQAHLCRSDSRVHSVNLSRAMEPVPSMAEVQAGRRRAWDGLVRHKVLISHSFCPAPSAGGG